MVSTGGHVCLLPVLVRFLFSGYYLVSCSFGWPDYSGISFEFRAKSPAKYKHVWTPPYLGLGSFIVPFGTLFISMIKGMPIDMRHARHVL